MDLENNQLVLWQNDRKSDRKHPDFTGKMRDANGKIWDVAAWAYLNRGDKKDMIKALISEPQQKDYQKQGERSYKQPPQSAYRQITEPDNQPF